ncbi:uncharacterized protein DEA37_0004217, partial [Paragonimus westermani]
GRLLEASPSYNWGLSTCTRYINGLRHLPSVYLTNHYGYLCTVPLLGWRIYNITAKSRHCRRNRTST